MEPVTISNLLKLRNAWLKGDAGDHETADARADISRRISHDYPVFEDVRDHLIANSDAYLRGQKSDSHPLQAEGTALLEVLLAANLAFRNPEGTAVCELEGRKYLSGGWLEELAWLAIREAGADEAIFGQVLGWKVKEYSGENEIDVIARKGSALAFVSCKALRSMFDVHDRKHRNRLMDAVHEADNLTDHFGRGGEKVAVLVTTDLFDEMRGVARYNALMGKAAVLDVRIIPLEELDWHKLVDAMRCLWDTTAQEREKI